MCTYDIEVKPPTLLIIFIACLVIGGLTSYTIVELDKTNLQHCMDDCYTSDSTLKSKCRIKCIDTIPEKEEFNIGCV